MPERPEHERRLEDALRAAWRGLEPPEATPEDADPRTAACVDWMRAAWEQLEPPPARVPGRLRRGRLRGSRPWLAAAAAAAALLLLWARVREEAPPAPVAVEELAVGEIPSPPRVEREGDALVLERGSVRLLLLTPVPGPSGADPNTRPETED